MDFEYLDSYGWCLGYSWYHDLTCGHRIRSPYKDVCGTTCANRPHATGVPFICQQCIRDEVEVELKLTKFTIKTDGEVMENYEEGAEIPFTDKVRIVADRKVKAAMRARYPAKKGGKKMGKWYFDFRMSVPAPKLNTPMEMFYNSIAEEEEEKDRAKEKTVATRTKVPGKAAAKPVAKPNAKGFRVKKEKKEGMGRAGAQMRVKYGLRGDAKVKNTRLQKLLDMASGGVPEEDKETKVPSKAEQVMNNVLERVEEKKVEMERVDEIAKAVQKALEMLNLE